MAHLIDAHSQINPLCLINASPLMLSLYCPHENCSKILGKNKKERNHSNYSVSFLINKDLPIASCSKSHVK